jgi:hypothetical protein
MVREAALPKKQGDAREWLCPNGHLLGHVEHDAQGFKLHIYRYALNTDHPVAGARAEVGVVTRGWAVIHCSVPGCHAEREWYSNEEALARLFRRRVARRKE